MSDPNAKHLPTAADLELRFEDAAGLVVGFAPWVADYYEQRRLRDKVEVQTGAVVARIIWGEK